MPLDRAQNTAAQFNIALTGTLAQIHADIVSTARREHAKIMAAEPKPVNYTRWVDGREGAAEETVTPRGVIVYEYNRYDLVAQFALDELRKASPVKSGDYARAHTLFLNGAAVDTLKGWKQGDEIAISNLEPYARKIELGKMKMSVPPHVYERVELIVKRRYAEIASVVFTWRGIVGGASINQATAASSRGAGKRAATGSHHGGAHNKSDIRYPTLLIVPPR